MPDAARRGLMLSDSSKPPSPVRLPADLARDWAARGVALAKGALDGACAARWEAETRDRPGGQRCVPRFPLVTWFEQSWLDAERAEPCDGLALNPSFYDQCHAISGLGPFDPAQTQVWINRYQPGDWIPPHEDKSGDVQVLVCLEAPPAGETGGVLHVLDQPYPLATGDVVLFRASGLEHRMTQIEGDTRGASGASRVVFIVRLFTAAQ
jgi:alkylated DNA repair dioxygenase AlkB